MYEHKIPNIATFSMEKLIERYKILNLFVGGCFVESRNGEYYLITSALLPSDLIFDPPDSPPIYPTIGQCFYSKTLTIPVWWDGSHYWRNAVGIIIDNP